MFLLVFRRRCLVGLGLAVLGQAAGGSRLHREDLLHRQSGKLFDDRHRHGGVHQSYREGIQSISCFNFQHPLNLIIGRPLAWLTIGLTSGLA